MDDLPAVAEIPDNFRDDKYFALNDDYAQRLNRAYKEAERLAGEMETWQVAAARMTGEGETIEKTAKQLRKTHKTISAFLRTLGGRQLAQAYACISILKKPIPKNVRAQMLWRIAVDNELVNPDVARKALNDLNGMLDPKNTGAGQTLQIVINNEVLPKGALDG